MSGANYPIWQLDVEVAESELPMECAAPPKTACPISTG
jgi:hypothetical protein